MYKNKTLPPIWPLAIIFSANNQRAQIHQDSHSWQQPMLVKALAWPNPLTENASTKEHFIGYSRVLMMGRVHEGYAEGRMHGRALQEGVQ